MDLDRRDSAPGIPLLPSPGPHRPDAAVAFQDRVAAAFGIQPEDREAIVRGMLERSARAAAGYWLQLFLAMGIAYFGLVLGSGAVVIGAMLISPLMGPIVELGMGLAIGSPFLAMRSFARVASSIVVVVSCAALLTLTLPFYEVTAEIAARTSPTALDLLIAIFCAIAAAYTTVRPGSDTTSTAAGTAIGIALVPPLCVIGYGIGTRAEDVASGAALLFTANLCAILLFAILCFLLLGYSAVSTAELERAELAKQKPGIIRRMARALQFFFGLRHGWLFRVLMPLALLGAVYLPLREALARVTWQVRVRTAIQGMLDALPQSTVRSSVYVDHGSVVVRLVTLGRAEEAERIERDLRGKIAAVAGVEPKVDVIAVLDAGALKEVAASVKAQSAPIEVVREEPDLVLLRRELAASLAGAWPHAAGPLVAWRLRFPENEPVLVEVVHLGPELGLPAADLLGRALTRELGAEIAVQGRDVPPEPLVAEPGGGLAWFPSAARALAWVGETEALHGCVEVPAQAGEKPDREVEAVTLALRSLPGLPAERLQIREGDRWRAVVSASPCAPPPEAAPGDAGAPGDASAVAPGNAGAR
ncbi:uncharacterized protein SOCE26_039700 [Sorangium cellulosum]|uniref:TIGR00341 family protein n=1 Tax=Sorangium cellulosum TaxID=56 RepID=A0A2L0ETB2_SORCE|nr:DUF389 domain-containing protein [Sorangium cellulosum]AUX42537.1 uncharacterized protein SOCE26_039700 [Sorangium cellulosum]